MPGIRFGYAVGGNVGVPNIVTALLAGGAGGGIVINSGDFVVKTTKANLTANNVPVIRTLLQADITALYQQTALIAGIFGLALEDVTTNLVGQATVPPALGGIATGGQMQYAYGYTGLLGIDANTQRGQGRVIPCTSQMVFACKLDPASAPSTPALIGTLAALKLTGTLPSLFTIDTTGGSTNIVRIVAVNQSDPLYGLNGGEVFFQILDAYQQFLTAVPYSAN